MMTLPGQGVLLDCTGHSSRARVRRAPTLLPAREPRLPFSGPGAMIFAVFAGLLWQVLTASATTTGQDRIHQQPAALQEWKCSLVDKCCPAGFYLSERSCECTPCLQGVDFTAHSNNLSSCLFCSKCYPGEEEISPCTTTKDRECQCKPGTFRDKHSPELCQQCSTRCPEGMVKAEPCTPWSDLQCVKQTPGTQAPVPGEAVPTSPGPPTAPSPSSGSSQLVIVIAAVSVLLLLLLLIACARYHRWRILPGFGGDPECLNTVGFLCPCSSRKPGALDNACNEIMSNRESMSSLASEQELGYQEDPQLAGGQSPAANAERLLGPAGAKVSQMRRMQLVPADGTDPIKSLRLCFDYFSRFVPFNAWERFMRQLGLEPNDICVAKARACDPREALYEMLMIWLNGTGRAASVNTLLDALNTLGERDALESIENQLVCSGKYVYEEGGAGSAVL